MNVYGSLLMEAQRRPCRRRDQRLRRGVELMADTNLQATVIAYLESKGWYFDWDHIHDVWGSDSPTSLDKRPDAIRELHGWTVPQWGDYWGKPYDDDPTHENFGAPRSRRHESLKDAIWSQLLREENPEQFAAFFDDDKAASDV